MTESEKEKSKKERRLRQRAKRKRRKEEQKQRWLMVLMSPSAVDDVAVSVVGGGPVRPRGGRILSPSNTNISISHLGLILKV